MQSLTQSKSKDIELTDEELQKATKDLEEQFKSIGMKVSIMPEDIKNEVQEVVKNQTDKNSTVSVKQAAPAK